MHLTLADRVERWLSFVSDAINELETIIKNVYLTEGEKTKCRTYLSQFLSIRQLLRRCLGIYQQLDPRVQQQESVQPAEVFGGQIEQHEEPVLPQNVSWDYFESAFAGRIRSGVIGNLGLLDIKSFMQEAKPLFVQKISEVSEEHPAIKVNTDLAADFSVVK